METFVTIIHVVVAFFMILVVLVQGGNQGGVGAAFGGGGGAGSVMGATGSQSLLGKLTYGAAAIFMVTSIILTKVQSGSSTDLRDRLQQRSSESASGEALAPETSPAAGATEVPVEKIPADQ